MSEIVSMAEPKKDEAADLQAVYRHQPMMATVAITGDVRQVAEQRQAADMQAALPDMDMTACLSQAAPVDARRVQGERSLELPVGLIGIANLGNTCYMNTILQVLLHSPILRHFFLAGAAPQPSASPPTASEQVIHELDAVFQEAYSAPRRAIMPARLLSACWLQATYMAGYRQHDAHEFYLSVLSALDTICVDPTRPGAFADAAAGGPRGAAAAPPLATLVFGGELQSDVSCSRCGHVSRAFDPVMDIAIDVDTQLQRPPPPPPLASPDASGSVATLSPDGAPPGSAPVSSSSFAVPGGSARDAAAEDTASRACTPGPGAGDSTAPPAAAHRDRGTQPALLLSVASAEDCAECAEEPLQGSCELPEGCGSQEVEGLRAPSDRPAIADPPLTDGATSSPCGGGAGRVAVTGVHGPGTGDLRYGGVSSEQLEQQAESTATPPTEDWSGADPGSHRNDCKPVKLRAHETEPAEGLAATDDVGRSPAALSLTGCLWRFIRQESLPPGSWRCSACGSSSSAHKQLSVRRLPPVLCFHIKRFRLGNKLEVPLQFPTAVLDMRPFLSSSVIAARRGVRGPTPLQRSAPHAGLYRLIAVVQHTGSLHSGHYVMYLQLEGEWFLCDDANISRVSEAMVAQAQPYMLFYTHHPL